MVAGIDLPLSLLNAITAIECAGGVNAACAARSPRGGRTLRQAIMLAIVHINDLASPTIRPRAQVRFGRTVPVPGADGPTGARGLPPTTP